MTKGNFGGCWSESQAGGIFLQQPSSLLKATEKKKRRPEGRKLIKNSNALWPADSGAHRGYQEVVATRVQFHQSTTANRSNTTLTTPVKEPSFPSGKWQFLMSHFVQAELASPSLTTHIGRWSSDLSQLLAVRIALLISVGDFNHESLVHSHSILVAKC